jgi:hypothetical protein
VREEDIRVAPVIRNDNVILPGRDVPLPLYLDFGAVKYPDEEPGPKTDHEMRHARVLSVERYKKVERQC